MTPVPTRQWRRSSYSNGMGGECVEVALAPGVIAVRDSKAPLGPQVAMSVPAWRAFVKAVQSAKMA
ncbi:DUF397 domain-containing protein [Streptomyces sp. NPDC003032]